MTDMTTIYTGECPKCGTEHRREWHGEPWKGFDGETHYAADCRKCGPGHELQMFSEPTEEEGEIVEVFSLDPSWNGQTMVADRKPARTVADRIEEAVRYARDGGAGFDSEVQRNIAELGARRAISMLTREEGFYDPAFATADPDTITLTRLAFTNALREAAAEGMDHNSGPSGGYAASCRDVADGILQAIDAGRFVPDDYVGYVEVERRVAS